MDSRIKNAFAVLFFLTPLTAYADHEDVFATIFIGFGLTLFLVVLTFFLKIRISGKLLIIGLVLTATYFTFKYTDTMPYYENANLINTLVAVDPSVVFLISYVGLKAKFRTE
jgi:hypothetical protein